MIDAGSKRRAERIRQEVLRLLEADVASADEGERQIDRGLAAQPRRDVSVAQSAQVDVRRGQCVEHVPFRYRRARAVVEERERQLRGYGGSSIGRGRGRNGEVAKTGEQLAVDDRLLAEFEAAEKAVRPADAR